MNVTRLGLGTNFKKQHNLGGQLHFAERTAPEAPSAPQRWNRRPGSTATHWRAASVPGSVRRRTVTRSDADWSASRPRSPAAGLSPNPPTTPASPLRRRETHDSVLQSPLRPDAQPLPSLGARQGARKTVSRGAPSGRWSVFPGVDAPARSAVMELPEASIGAGPQCAETRPFRAQSVGQRGRGGSPRWWPLRLDILDTGCWISVKP